MRGAAPSIKYNFAFPWRLNAFLRSRQAGREAERQAGEHWQAGMHGRRAADRKGGSEVSKQEEGRQGGKEAGWQGSRKAGKQGGRRGEQVSRQTGRQGDTKIVRNRRVF